MLRKGVEFVLYLNIEWFYVKEAGEVCLVS